MIWFMAFEVFSFLSCGKQTYKSMNGSRETCWEVVRGSEQNKTTARAMEESGESVSGSRNQPELGIVRMELRGRMRDGEDAQLSDLSTWLDSPGIHKPVSTGKEPGLGGDYRHSLQPWFIFGTYSCLCRGDVWELWALAWAECLKSGEEGWGKGSEGAPRKIGEWRQLVPLMSSLTSFITSSSGLNSLISKWES